MTTVTSIQSMVQPVAKPVDERPQASTVGLIGELLVEAGAMTAEQVGAVLAAQKAGGGRFGEIAIRLRFATNEQVQSALARQFGYSTSLAVSNAKLAPNFAAAINPVTPFSESIRTLRSQLMMRWFDGSPSQACLAITSVDRADGKSFVVANLGVAFSQMGEKTLIIDADMRNPTQHEIFGLPNKLGLSGILSGRAGLEEVARIEGLPNLAVLSSGPLPPNPQELLGRQEFSQFLNELSGVFDVILVDTPSAQQASDAHVIAQRARGCVIVARKGRTRAQEISQLADVFSNSGISILGATFNEY